MNKQTQLIWKVRTCDWQSEFHKKRPDNSESAPNQHAKIHLLFLKLCSALKEDGRRLKRCPSFLNLRGETLWKRIGSFSKQAPWIDVISQLIFDYSNALKAAAVCDSSPRVQYLSNWISRTQPLSYKRPPKDLYGLAGINRAPRPFSIQPLIHGL